MPDVTFQKISTLISKTCGTGLRALRLRLRQRYCFVALMNVVASFDDVEYMIDEGSTKTRIWEFSIVSTRCRDTSFERMA